MEDYQQADLAVNNNMYYIDLILLYDVAAVGNKKMLHYSLYVAFLITKSSDKHRSNSFENVVNLTT